MKTNMGTIDRVVRLIFSLAVGALIIAGVLTGALAITLGTLAVIMLATASVAWCPLYIPLHLSTKKGEKSPKTV